MTRFLPSEEAVDFAESGRKRGQDRVACFLHLRDLVYVHPKAASASAVSFVQTLEATVIAEKVAREKKLAEARAREASRLLRGDRQKVAAETEEFLARTPEGEPVAAANLARKPGVGLATAPRSIERRAFFNCAPARAHGKARAGSD